MLAMINGQSSALSSSKLLGSSGLSFKSWPYTLGSADYVSQFLFAGVINLPLGLWAPFVDSVNSNQSVCPNLHVASACRQISCVLDAEYAVKLVQRSMIKTALTQQH